MLPPTLPRIEYVYVYEYADADEDEEEQEKKEGDADGISAARRPDQKRNTLHFTLHTQGRTSARNTTTVCRLRGESSADPNRFS